MNIHPADTACPSCRGPRATAGPSLVLSFAQPGVPLSMNAKEYHHAAARRRVLGPWRSRLAAALTIESRTQPEALDVVRRSRCSFEVSYGFARNAARDAHNYHATTKGLLDELTCRNRRQCATYGPACPVHLWVDDTDAYVTVPAPLLVVPSDVCEVRIVPLSMVADLPKVRSVRSLAPGRSAGTVTTKTSGVALRRTHLSEKTR